MSQDTVEVLFVEDAEFDGLAALGNSKQMVPQVPFIFVSGTIVEERAIEAIRRGATACVPANRK